jgi:hypothetical protein
LRLAVAALYGPGDEPGQGAVACSGRGRAGIHPSVEEVSMDHDTTKLDEIVLTLLHLNGCRRGQAWEYLTSNR